MKFIAIFLTLNMLLLSSFSDMAKIRYEKASYCKAKIHKDCCKKQKHSSNNDCTKSTCTTMLSCGNCSFLISLPVFLSPAINELNGQKGSYYLPGELSSYQDNDWNPPKA